MRVEGGNDKNNWKSKVKFPADEDQCNLFKREDYERSEEKFSSYFNPSYMASLNTRGIGKTRDNVKTLHQEEDMDIEVGVGVEYKDGQEALDKRKREDLERDKRNKEIVAQRLGKDIDFKNLSEEEVNRIKKELKKIKKKERSKKLNVKRRERKKLEKKMRKNQIIKSQEKDS